MWVQEWEQLLSSKDFKVSLVKFELIEIDSAIKISGEEFDISSLNNLLNILKKIHSKNNNKNIKITGNFNSKLLLNLLLKNKNFEKIDKILHVFQEISKIIQESKIIFTSEIKGIAKGPALEIALACNFIKASNDVMFYLHQDYLGIMPFFGTAQRLSRLIGYSETLKAFLIDKTLNYEKCLMLDLINHNTDNVIKIKNNKTFWDQTFTNTFIFYNSKIHSQYKNQITQYNALLSTIFESCICDYEAGPEIEKRWLKWLINKEYLDGIKAK